MATLALLALMVPGGASAGSTATRCDAHGCAHIHCNSTGDRCYRYDEYSARDGHRDCAGCEDGHEHGYSGRGGSAAHRLCDSDGDRCYSSDERHWSYREYYRRRGYRWDN
ncbi:MAG: hypothetical protein ACREHF_00150 [Rhizomicrobium sp.]